MKSAIRSPNLQIWAMCPDKTAFAATGRPRSLRLHRLETCSGSPPGHLPAPKRRKRARGRLSQKLWPSPGKLFREARRASPQRQNNGARASDGAGLPWLSRKLRPSPGKLFREAQRARSQPQNYGSERERRAPFQAVAEASTVAEKVFSGSPTGPTLASKRRERAFGQPDGPDPSPNLR